MKLETELEVLTGISIFCLLLEIKILLQGRGNKWEKDGEWN